MKKTSSKLAHNPPNFFQYCPKKARSAQIVENPYSFLEISYIYLIQIFGSEFALVQKLGVLRFQCISILYAFSCYQFFKQKFKRNQDRELKFFKFFKTICSLETANSFKELRCCKFSNVQKNYQCSENGLK